MVDEILRHPNQDFSQDLAFKLGVGDLFERFLMEQSSTHKTSKEKVEKSKLKNNISLSGLLFDEAVEVCGGRKRYQEKDVGNLGEPAKRETEGAHPGNH